MAIDDIGLPVERRVMTVKLLATASPSEIGDLFETFGMQVVGSAGSDAYFVMIADPGPNWQDVLDAVGALNARSH